MKIQFPKHYIINITNEKIDCFRNYRRNVISQRPVNFLKYHRDILINNP